MSSHFSRLPSRSSETSEAGRPGSPRRQGSRHLRALGLATLLGCAAGAGLLTESGAAWAARALPEDLLKGRMIISDRPLPTAWQSPGAYAAQLKGMNKTAVHYDKKTGKVTIHYAAFFAQPVNDVQVDFVIYDITGGGRIKKGSWEAFLGRRGERVIFNSVELDKEFQEMNRKYLFTIENRRKILAAGEVIVRGEGPHYSGKVEFSDEEAKQK